MRRMEGKTVLVTGASSGIGRATAVEVAREGASVALLALPGADLEEAADACRSTGATAMALAADVADAAAVAGAFEAAERELGPVDAVFNNAGISTIASIAETTDEDWHRLLATNLTGSFHVLREAARRMAPRGAGTVVNTASELALVGEAGYAAYTATKGGVLAMTRSAAAELASDGIRVNAVCPGSTDTPMLQAEYETARDPGAARADGERSIALGRIAQPEDIARVVAFLLSDEARYVTGAHFVVDGGRTSCFPAAALTAG
jgi:NAD(P)-dependent dehydrogenase (short-subunit alcohol dehydrogenase family)